MKNLIIVTCLVLFGCSSKNEAEENKTSEEIIAENLINKTFNVPKSLEGTYISVDYLERLKEKKSTLLAQDVATVSMLSILKKNGKHLARVNFNFHESSDENNLKMISKESATISSSDVSDELYKLLIDKSGAVFLILEDKPYKLVKFNNLANKPAAELINQTLFEGQYLLDGKTVKFTKNGQIIGLDSLISYEVNVDYIDAGMDFDKIYFAIKGKEKNDGLGEEFGYKFSKDTLKIFRLNCIEYEPNTPGFCVEHSKGETVYKLIKQ